MLPEFQVAQEEIESRAQVRHTNIKMAAPAGVVATCSASSHLVTCEVSYQVFMEHRLWAARLVLRSHSQQKLL